jgi:tetratricopeptide (TPR) repeat protein
MSGIFISYRREDSQALAGRLFDRLGGHFGKDRVFRDIDTLDPGARFAEVIGERISGCDVLVALIGKGWLDAKDAEGRRRLDLPRDYVKAEIAAALAQDKLVIPVLLEGTPMPSREALPEELAPLAGRNALQMSDGRFDYDVGRLIEVIGKVLAPQGGTPHGAGQWAWLSNAPRQRTLAFFGAGIAVVVLAAAWTAYVRFTEKAKPLASTVTASQRGIAAGQNVTARAAQGGVAVVATGPVTIGITLKEYEERLRQRERQIREESRKEYESTSQADKDRIILLQKQLAAAQAQLQSPEQGLEKYKEVLAGASASLGRLGDKIPAVLLDRARQALARGDTVEAERLFEKVLGEDKTRAAEAAYQLGQLAESRIDYATAAKYFAEAVRLAPQNAQYLDAAGRNAYTLGRYGDAEPILEHALAIRKRALGPEHPDVAKSLNNLALLYEVQGLYAKAEPLLEQSLAILKKALGPEHPDVATSLNNLAELYRAQGLYAKAEPLYRESLAIRKKVLGPAHRDVAQSLNNLALLYHAEGLYTKAEPLLEQSLAILKKALGPEHPDVATSLNNLAELYRAQGQYAKAEPLYQESLAMMKQTLGTEHPQVTTVMENYAELLTSLKRDKEAAEMLAQAKKIRGK